MLKALKKQLPSPGVFKGSYCFHFSAVFLPLAISARAPSSLLFLNLSNNLDLSKPFKSIPSIGLGNF